MCGRGRAGVRQARTAQYGGRMFVFAATLGVEGDRAYAMRTRLGENRNFISRHRGSRNKNGETDKTPQLSVLKRAARTKNVRLAIYLLTVTCHD